jgi:DnaJ like chaperone protein
VTEADIQIASVFMDRMNLHGDSRLAAQNAFRIGKSDNYPLREKMRQFRSICFGRFDLIRMFLEIQIQAAFADGSLHLMNVMCCTSLRKSWGSPACSSTSSCA